MSGRLLGRSFSQCVVLFVLVCLIESVDDVKR